MAAKSGGGEDALPAKSTQIYFDPFGQRAQYLYINTLRISLITGIRPPPPDHLLDQAIVYFAGESVSRKFERIRRVAMADFEGISMLCYAAQV